MRLFLALALTLSTVASQKMSAQQGYASVTGADTEAPRTQAPAPIVRKLALGDSAHPSSQDTRAQQAIAAAKSPAIRSGGVVQIGGGAYSCTQNVVDGNRNVLNCLPPDVMQLDRRAWISNVRVQGDLVYGRPFDAELDITNAGSTPAYNVHFWGHIATLHAYEHPYFTYPQATGAPGNLAPHQTYTKLLQGNDGRPINYATVAGVGSGAYVLYVYGRMDYTDQFGKPHWVTFCSQKSGTGSFAVCDRGNDSDGNPAYGLVATR